jgi:hypothetical protein
MNVILQFLKTVGVGHPTSPGKSRREDNRKRWQEEKDRKEKRRGHKHRHYFDDHSNPDDWTY